MKRTIVLLLSLMLSGAAMAQESASYKIELHAFNAGGHPMDGFVVSSATYELRLGAIGESVTILDGSSGSFRVSGGFVPVLLRFDTDADGWPDARDCDPLSGLVHAVPSAVEMLSIDGVPGAFTLQWASQALSSGAGTVYDNFSGDMGAVTGSQGDFSTGLCLAENVTVISWDYLGPMPGPGQAAYFMLRGQNRCGTGTYGTPSRDATAGSSVVPCS